MGEPSRVLTKVLSIDFECFGVPVSATDASKNQ